MRSICIHSHSKWELILKLNKKLKFFISSWVILLPVSLLFILFFATIENTFSILYVFLLFLFTGLLFVLLISNKKNRMFNSNLFLTIFCFNVTTVIILCFVFKAQFGNYYLYGGTDDMNYDKYGMNAAKNFQKSGKIIINSPRWEKYRGYITVVALVHTISRYFGNESTINPRLLNSLSIGLTSVLLALIAMNLKFSANVSYLAGFTSGIYPVQAYWGSIIVRDILIILFVAASILFYVQLNKKTVLKVVFSIFGLSVCVFIIWLLRKESAYLMISIISFIFLYQKSILKPMHYKIFVFLFLFFVLILFRNLIQPTSELINTFAENSSQYRLQLSGGLSTIIFSQSLIPFGIFIRPIYAIVSPLPVLSANPLHIVNSFGTIFWLLLIPFGMVGFRNAIFDKEKCIIALSAIFLLLGISLTTFHPRHLLIYAPFGFVLNAYGIEITKKRKEVFIASIIVYLILFGLYQSLKV